MSERMSYEDLYRHAFAVEADRRILWKAARAYQLARAGAGGTQAERDAWLKLDAAIVESPMMSEILIEAQNA